jgi:hypothetical protein
MRRSDESAEWFDHFYTGREYFVRPVRKGQKEPFAPPDVPEKGNHHLVQDLRGGWVALVSDKPFAAMFAEMRQHDVIPLYMN